MDRQRPINGAKGGLPHTHTCFGSRVAAGVCEEVAGESCGGGSSWRNGKRRKLIVRPQVSIQSHFELLSQIASLSCIFTNITGWLSFRQLGEEDKGATFSLMLAVASAEELELVVHGRATNNVSISRRCLFWSCFCFSHLAFTCLTIDFSLNKDCSKPAFNFSPVFAFIWGSFGV